MIWQKKAVRWRRRFKAEIIAIIIGVIALVVAVKRNDETQYKIRLLEQEINKIAELVADLSSTIHKDTIRRVKQAERLPKPRLPSISNWLMVA